MTVNQFALLLGEMGRATDSKEGIQPLQRNKFAGGGFLSFLAESWLIFHFYKALNSREWMKW